MIAYIELLRPLNSLMSAVAVLIGGFLLLQGINYLVVFGMIAVFLITGAGNAINDYLDVESDRVNRPKRPIPSGRISKRATLLYSILLFAVGIAITGFINYLAFIIAIINTIILIVYSSHLQNMTIAGNAAVAYLVGSTFLFGGAVVINPAVSLWSLMLPLLLMLLSSLSTFSREIVKDLEDLEGDKEGFLKRLKQKVKRAVMERFHLAGDEVRLKYSEKTAIYIAIASLLVAIILSPLPYLLNILRPSYLVVLIPTDIAFALGAGVLLTRGRQKYKTSGKTIKVGMFLGLVAFIVGMLV